MLNPPAGVEYGVRAAVHLAQKYATGQVVKAAEIASEGGIPLPFLQRLLARLQRAGLVTSARGVRGGYRLARAPGAIRVLDVVEALAAATPESTQRSELGFLWERSRDAWRGALHASLAEVADEIERSRRALMFQI